MVRGVLNSRCTEIAHTGGWFALVFALLARGHLQARLRTARTYVTNRRFR
jgi:hypothetical protein